MSIAVTGFAVNVWNRLEGSEHAGVMMEFRRVRDEIKGLVSQLIERLRPSLQNDEGEAETPDLNP